MNQHPSCTDQQQPQHIYTGEEQRQRWTLIIHALLSALGPEVTHKEWMKESSSAPQPAQRA
jgi:hypothetical protein